MTSKTDITVAKLVEMIASGELTLPEMQRGYVWKADRVRDLLDSLYRGYPSGTILVWETDSEVPSRELAVKQDTSPFKGHKMLLDGQQRLTSLSSILRGEPVKIGGVAKPIEILFNLDHPDGPPSEEPKDDLSYDAEDDDDDYDDYDAVRQPASPVQERTRHLAFSRASQALLASPTWIRVSDIFSDKSEQELLHRALPGGWANPNHKKYSERVQRVRKIRDYNYVMQVLEKTMEYEEVAKIFVRVNSGGMKLRSSDLALAQITSRWRDSLRLFEEFREQCGKMVDLGLVVRALVVFATGQSRFKSVGSLSRERLEEAWSKAKTNVKWALHYLEGLSINTGSLLSSPFLIIALAYYHEHHPILTGEDARNLRRWLLQANARGRYSRGSTETLLDSDLTSIRSGRRADHLLEVLERQVGHLVFSARELVGMSTLNPVLPVLFLAMRARNAADLQTGTHLVLPSGGGRPRLNNWQVVFAKPQGVEKREQKELANIMFINAAKRGKKNAAATEKWAAETLRCHGEGALRAHGLPVELDLYKPTAFRSFLEYRRQKLADILNGYIDGPQEGSLTEEKVAALVREGESVGVELKQRAFDDKGKVLYYVGKGVASFMNASGGVLFIGVDDDGTPCGIEADVQRLTMKDEDRNEDKYQLQLVHHLMTVLGSACVGYYQVRILPFAGKRICAVEVERAPASVYVTADQQSKFWVRVGNQAKELKGKEIEEYLKQRK